MKYEDIITLAKAGFNMQQIAALASVQATPAATPAPAAPTAPATETPAQANIHEQQLDMFNQLFGKIEGLQSSIQQAAINQSNQPEQPTVDDILAEIINPPAAGNK